MLRPTALALMLLLLAGCRNGQKPTGGGPMSAPAEETPPRIDQPAHAFQPVSQRQPLEDCPNCQTSDMTYEPGGPQPFPGNKCPICEGTGKLWGTVHWEGGYYDAPGYAATGKQAPSAVDRLKAQRGAEIAALRNAVRMAAQIRLDEGSTLEVRSGEVQLDAFVRGHQVVREKWYPGQGAPWAHKQIKLPMYGVSGLNARVYDTVSSSYQRSAAVFRGAGQVVMTEEVTHIVIDAREMDGIAPAFFARILTDDGEIVYDVKAADPDTVRTEGLMRYYFSDQPLEFGLLERGGPGRFGWRAGDRPLAIAALDRPWCVAQRRKRRAGRWRPVVIKASPSGKDNKCDVLVSRKDAERMAAAEKKSGTLRKASVVVVVGSRVAGKRGGRMPGVRYALR